MPLPSQFHEIACCSPSCVGLCRIRSRVAGLPWMVWSALSVLVKEDLGLTVMIGLVLAWRGRENESPSPTPLLFAAFWTLAPFVTVRLLLARPSTPGYGLCYGSSNRGGVTLIERALWPAQKYGVIAAVILGAGHHWYGIPGSGSSCHQLPWRFLVC